MNPFTVLPLKWALPILFAGLVALIGALSLFNSYHNNVQALLEQAQRDLHAYASLLALEAEHHPYASELAQIEEIGFIHADPRTKAVLLLTDTGVIRGAHRRDWIGRRLVEVLPGFAGIDWATLAAGRIPHYRHDAEHGQAYALRAFALPAQATEVRSLRHGLALVVFDLVPARQALFYQSLIERRLEMVATLLLFVLGVWTMHRLVTHPIAKLAVASQDLAQGKRNTRADVRGGHEIRSLATSFNTMADALEREHQKLSASRAHIATMLRSLGDGLIATDAQGRVTLMNPVAEKLTGWASHEAVGRPIAEIFDIFDARTGEAAVIPVMTVLRDGITVSLANHTVLRARGGERYHIADTAAPIRVSPDGPIEGAVLVFHDVSEQYRLRQALADSERHYRTLANSGMALIWTSDSSGRCNWFNDPWLRFTGRSLEQELGDGWAEGVHPEDLERVLASYRTAFAKRAPISMEYRLRHASGDYRWIVDNGSPAYDANGEFSGYLGYCLDITDLKRAQAEIERLAYYDDLTGLPNRALFLDRLGQALSIARRKGNYGAVVFIDLDHFKRINDVHGHAVGDALLEELAHRLMHYLRDTDTVARLGGDEFVVLLPELARTREDAGKLALTVAEKLRATLSMPIAIAGQEFITGASLGITVFPKGEEGVHDLMREADVAMYRAKDRGRNQVVYFEPSMQEAVTQRYTLEGALRAALQGEGLELYLQSQVDKAGSIVGAKALLRWRHPQQGLISPATFIPLAEESGLIVPLGEWVLRESCRLIRQLDTQGLSLRIAVNVSPRQFREPDFVQRVRHILTETGADPSRLMLEITENLLVDHPHEVVARMSELASLGIRFAIDDFGTGYSSLAYLKRLPLFELKIDKTFVQDVPHDANDVALVETILSMARHLQLEVVAEGVETAAQLDFLISRGCSRFQGYYWQRPLPVAEWFAGLPKTAGRR